MSSSEKQKEIRDLLVRFFEGDLDDQQRQQLLTWSRNSPDACQYYCDYAKDYAIIHTLIASQIRPEYGTSDDTKFDQALWKAMAEFEKAAPEVEVAKSKPEEESVSNEILPPLTGRRVSRFSMVWLGAAAAVLLLMIGFFYFVPHKTMVAEITATMNAEWKSGSFALEPGDLLYNTDKPRFLKSGIVEIKFDYGAVAVLEGPCEFSCKSAGLLGLQYGRVYAKVPVQASGFTIVTPISRIVDIGTEFGVDMMPNGSCSTQVHKGKARIISSLLKGQNASDLIEARQARKVDSQTGVIRESAFDGTAYVRSFDPSTKRVWRGEKINLADILGGGNGFGTGRYDVCGINPLNGSIHEKKRIHGGRKTEQSLYSPVPELPYIDGVFIPSPALGPVQVSSRGHQFTECPPTTPECYSNILNQPSLYADPQDSPSNVMAGIAYGTTDRPGIFIHSNAGITFDLDAIRRDYPDLSIEKFVSTCGLVDVSNPKSSTDRLSKADFWVLVDGEKRAMFHSELSDSNDRNAGTVEVVIEDEDRFLTLVVTESVDATVRDWGLFGIPYLVLE